MMPLCSQLLLLVVQLLSRVRFSATPRTAALQASLSFAISWSLLKILSIDSVMPSNQLVFCQPRQEFLLQEKSKNLLWEFTGSQCPHSTPGSGFVPAQRGSQSSPLRRASGQGTGGQVVTCWSTDPAEQVWGGRPPGLQVLGAMLPQDEVRGLDVLNHGPLGGGSYILEVSRASRFFWDGARGSLQTGGRVPEDFVTQ